MFFRDLKEKHMSGRRSLIIHMSWLIACLLAAIIFAASIGAAKLSMADSFRIILSGIPGMDHLLHADQIRDVYFHIVWEIRMPRILLSGLVGGSLAFVGATFQGLFRNSLADPHILGVSSGAAVGATIAMVSGISITFLGLSAICLSAFAGAAITAFVVYRLSCIGNRLPTIHLLLTGIAVGSFLTATISIIMACNRDQIEKVYIWTLGSFSSATMVKVKIVLLFAALITTMVFLEARKLDIISTGDETAESLGVHTGNMKKRLILFSSLLVGACVSVSGIIGFVGLIIPHGMRLLSGPRHARLLPLCFVSGAIFMILCDAIARTVTAPTEIPVGVITSIVGAPYFIFLLTRSKRKLVV